MVCAVFEIVDPLFIVIQKLRVMAVRVPLVQVPIELIEAHFVRDPALIV